MEMALFHRRGFDYFRCRRCHLCPSGFSDDDPMAHASGEGTCHQANGRGCRYKRPGGGRRAGARILASHYRLEGVVVGDPVDFRNRRPVVQRVLPDVDYHAGIQSDGVAGVGCTALPVHCIFFIFLVTVRGGIGG